MTARTSVRAALTQRHRNALLAMLAILVLAVASASVSSASALTLIGGKAPKAQIADRCTSQTVSVTTPATSGTASSLTVGNLDTTGCAGKTLVVAVYDPRVGSWAAAKKLEVTGIVNAATMTLTSTSSFTPSSSQKVYVTLGGWPVAGTWTYSNPSTAPLVTCVALNNPSLTCTATLTSLDKWGSPYSDYNAYFAVSSPSASTNVQWQITINLASSSFPFVARSMHHNNQSALGAGWTCAQMPMLVLTGQAGPNTALVGGGKTVSVYLNGHATAAAGDDLYVCP